MKIRETFGRVVNLVQTKGMEKALELLELNKKTIENCLKKREYLIQLKDFDVVIDKKDEFNQITLYLSEKKWSKKLLVSLKKSSEFKSMVVLLGNIKIGKKVYELRIGAFGFPTSELIKAILQFKK
ncbi:MAG: hypothetical protein QXS37_03545 [Candidatus Aenigmatarchaeota archaeon]